MGWPSLREALEEVTDGLEDTYVEIAEAEVWLAGQRAQTLRELVAKKTRVCQHPWRLRTICNSRGCDALFWPTTHGTHMV